MGLKRMLIAGAIAAAVTIALAPVAQAHGKLQAAEPQPGSAMASAPGQVRLKFNEALEPAFSKIRLADGTKAEVALGRTQVDKADPSVMSASLPKLKSGTYRVQWTTMTRDGHKAKGDYTFQIK